MESVAIIGSGCAGATAAIYTARADLSPVVYEGLQPGGQLTTTSVIENYPGFVDGIDGFELMSHMKSQAMRFGARFTSDKVLSLERTGDHFTITLGGGNRVEAQVVIIASGASARYLGLPGEEHLIGHGLSSCATCDGAFFRDQRVVVVGGGDTAMEDAIFLTRFAREVVIAHRRDTLRASKIMGDRAKANPKITFAWNTEVVEIKEEGGQVAGVVFQDTKTKERRDHACEGLFMAIGHVPNTDFLPHGLLPLDELGYIDVKGVVTDIPGLFVAGDVADHHYRQAVTAAGEGCKAALEAEAYLSEKGL